MVFKFFSKDAKCDQKVVLFLNIIKFRHKNSWLVIFDISGHAKIDFSLSNPPPRAGHSRAQPGTEPKWELTLGACPRVLIKYWYLSQNTFLVLVPASLLVPPAQGLRTPECRMYF